MKTPTSSPKKRNVSIVRPLAFKQVKAGRSAPSKRQRNISFYSVLCIAVLLGTTLFWALLSAKLQQTNADQTVNTYLYENTSTFRNALFPNAHTFLLKWPLFWLIHVLGATPQIFQLFTVLLCVATAGFFALILYRINRQASIFGTLVLCLASVLLLVPAQPYVGGILPVNMAMLATRNIEYIVYILALILLIRSTRSISPTFLSALACLTVLGASDKLFLTFSLGGALIMLVVSAVFRRRPLLILGGRWLVMSMIAAAASAALLWVIQMSGLTHISSTGAGGPYGLVHGFKPLAIGSIFGFLGLLTNFGANAAFDAAVLRAIPRILRIRLLSPGGMVYLLNTLIFIVGTSTAFKLVLSALHSKKPSRTLDNPSKLSLLMIFSSIAAAGAFVLSDHYYVVDARYLTIALFTVFIALATSLRHNNISGRHVYKLMPVLLGIAIIFATFAARSTYTLQKRALSDIHQRNELVVQALVHHKVDVLVGDYWRTIPIKDMARPHNITSMPMDGCTQPRDVLSSTDWKPDLNSRSFAYLLSYDKSLTNYPACNLDAITLAYGRPNSSVLIAGTYENPKEYILFYDQGIHKNTHSNLQAVLPITPDQLTFMDCLGNDTIMNIVAHQDDDLLFMSPDLLNDIHTNKCVRTVYVTAGDGGNDKLYWQARESGSEHAYSAMLKSDSIWSQRTLKLANKQYVTIVNPKGNSHISLVFMRLADGNQNGHGFRPSRDESLAKLEAGTISEMHSVDGQSAYNNAELITSLTTLMQIYKPTEIHTQADTNPNVLVSDHSDHLAVGAFTKLAHERYNTDIPIKYYIGYPVRDMPENINGNSLADKLYTFMAYAHSDGAVCHSASECENGTNYGFYLKRQYLMTP